MSRHFAKRQHLFWHPRHAGRYWVVGVIDAAGYGDALHHFHNFEYHHVIMAVVDDCLNDFGMVIELMASFFRIIILFNKLMTLKWLLWIVLYMQFFHRPWTRSLVGPCAALGSCAAQSAPVRDLRRRELGARACRGAGGRSQCEASLGLAGNHFVMMMVIMMVIGN